MSFGSEYFLSSPAEIVFLLLHPKEKLGCAGKGTRDGSQGAYLILDQELDTLNGGSSCFL